MYEFMDKIYGLKNYFTVLSLILWIFYMLLSKYYDIPQHMLVSIENIVLMCSIIGSYVVYSYTDNIVNRERIDKKLIYILDFISHVIPFIYIIFKFGYHKNVDLSKQIMHTIIFSMFYLSVIEEEKAYSFTTWNKSKLFLVSLLVLTIITIIRYCFNTTLYKL